MSIELVVWILLPMFFGAIFAAVSVACAWKAMSVGQCLALSAVLVCVTWSEVMLFNIARGAWPTFVPHIMLAMGFCITAGQIIRAIDKTM